VALLLAAVVATLVVGSSTALGLSAGATSRSATAGVVTVETTLYDGAAAGTAIVLTSSGEVLTNNHVIRGATAIRVTDTSTGRRYNATVVGYSVSKDIALLQLRNARGLETATLGNSSTVEVGDRVTAVGNAGGTGVLRTKAGRLTALGQTITVADDGGTTRLTGLIKTSAPLQPGDSGGPLLSEGRVIGIDAAASRNFTFQGGGGVGYAIPVNAARKLVRRIEVGRTTASVHVGATAFLGVSLAQPSYSSAVDGALVAGVLTGSPADTAGIGARDVITALAGTRVTSATKLRNLVLRLKPGQSVRITWLDEVTGTNSAKVRLVAGPPQ
jgi:S1-C subfamily serine protease